MNLLQMLGGENQDQVIGAIAGKLGIDPSTAKQAVEHLAPALSRGVRNNTQSQSGLNDLMGALTSGDHGRYLDDPGQITNQAGIDEGKAILGHILGSKDVSRNVAGHASQQTGIDSSVLQQMLPMLATALMGTLGKQAQDGGALAGMRANAAGQSGGNDAMDMLSSFLDADKDGSMVDDLLGMAKKFF